MCLGMQNDQDSSCQQSAEEGGNTEQVQSQKGTMSLLRWLPDAAADCAHHQDKLLQDDS